MRKLILGLMMAIAAPLMTPLMAPVMAQGTSPPAPLAYQQLDDPAQEAQAMELMHTLRCLTCQSQSIADSDAQMAGDMRHQVRSRILAGEDPETIRAWLVERYGDYVSYDPQVSATTWPLFAIPLVLLLVAGAVLRHRFVRKKSPASAANGSGLDA